MLFRSKPLLVNAAFAVEGQVKEKSRWCQLLKDLSEKFKVIQAQVLVCCHRTILDLRFKSVNGLTLYCDGLQALKSEHQILLKESEEYKKCLSDATQMTTTVHKYGNVCGVVTKS